MFDSWKHIAFGGAVALKRVDEEHLRHVLQAYDQLVEEFLCRLLVATTLHHAVELGPFLVHRSLQVVTLTFNGR